MEQIAHPLFTALSLQIAPAPPVFARPPGPPSGPPPRGTYSSFFTLCHPCVFSHSRCAPARCFLIRMYINLPSGTSYLLSARLLFPILMSFSLPVFHVLHLLLSLFPNFIVSFPFISSIRTSPLSSDSNDFSFPTFQLFQVCLSFVFRSQCLLAFSFDSRFRQLLTLPFTAPLRPAWTAPWPASWRTVRATSRPPSRCPSRPSSRPPAQTAWPRACALPLTRPHTPGCKQARLNRTGCLDKVCRFGDLVCHDQSTLACCRALFCAFVPYWRRCYFKQRISWER